MLITAIREANLSRVDQRKSAHALKTVNVKPVLVYLTHAQHADLQKLKAKLDVPVSEQIRTAIDRYLKQMESRK